MKPKATNIKDNMRLFLTSDFAWRWPKTKANCDQVWLCE